MTIFRIIIFVLLLFCLHDFLKLRQRHKIKKMDPIERYEYHRKKLKTKEIKRLCSLPYNEYLASYHWKLVRKAALHRDKSRCRDCGSGQQLQIHHKTYARKGFEKLSDVITVCDECHRIRHFITEKYK